MTRNKSQLLEERFKALIPDSEKFFECSKKPLRKSLRLNTLKGERKHLLESLKNQGFSPVQIPWSEDGFWVDAGKASETIDYFLGHYYLQEASSMIPPLMLNPAKEDFVLDAAAAPGGKTIHLSSLMENSGCVIANEPDHKRRATLRFNLSKYGVLNSIVSSMDFSRELKIKSRFDKILLDAPCSCEGQFRKNPASLDQWNLGKVMGCSSLQKRILINALKLLADKGVLVYSTCTLSPEENEEVIDFALKADPTIEVHPFGKQKFNYRPGILKWQNKKYNPQVEGCARIYPQDNDSEGFFIAKIVKCRN